MIKPCKICGANDRYSNGACKPCEKERTKRRLNTPCSICGVVDRYPSGPCKPCQLIRSKARDVQKRREADNKYRNKDRAAYLEKIKAYRAENREKVRIWERNKEAKRRAAKGKLSNNIEKILFAEQMGVCTCCGNMLGDNYHLDHIMPLSLGGTNTDNNVQLLRAECNLKKGAMHPDDWEKICLQNRTGGNFAP